MHLPCLYLSCFSSENCPEIICCLMIFHHCCYHEFYFVEMTNYNISVPITKHCQIGSFGKLKVLFVTNELNALIFLAYLNDFFRYKFHFIPVVITRMSNQGTKFHSRNWPLYQRSAVGIQSTNQIAIFRPIRFRLSY
jgi:hypothetical protein